MTTLDLKFLDLGLELRASGFLEIDLEPGLSWESVVNWVSSLLGRHPMAFDGTTNCFGVNYIECSPSSPSTYRSNSREAIGLHQEGYELETRPKFLGLYCVEYGGDDGQTIVADAQAALELIQSASEGNCPQAGIRFKRNSDGGLWTPWRSLIEHDEEGYRIRFAVREPGHREVELRGVPKLSILDIERRIQAQQHQQSWLPGRLLIINNFRCLHGRTSLSFDTKRLLLRMVF